MSTKVLILIPGKNARGGITNYYASIRKHLSEDYVYFERGSRNWPKRESPGVKIKRIISDYFGYINAMLFKQVSVVQITTAFYKASIIRDSIFIILAKIFRKKVVVFFRGWDDEYVYNLSGISLKLFKFIYFNTNALIDLSESNTKHLKAMGYQREIYLETTVVDINLIKGINVDQLIENRDKKEIKTILFLSRIEKEKGIYNLLEIFKSLKKENQNYKLIFAGDGNELNNLRLLVEKENISGVTIKGFVQGEEKKMLFKKATVFVFLSEFEGMPNAVLEAMAFGLPVVTTNVGGIASVFKDERNGMLINDYNKNNIVRYIESILTNSALYQAIGKQNYLESKNKFWSDKVSERIINIFKDIKQKR